MIKEMVEKNKHANFSHMLKKISLAAASVVGVATMALASFAHAASLITVPTTTASDALASVSDTLADPGTLLVIVAVIALPVVFWLIRRIIGLFPKGR